MNIPALGELKPHPQVPKWLRSEPIEIPVLLNQKLPFILEDHQESDQEEINRAIGAFLNLGNGDRDAAAEHVFNNYKEMKAYMDEDDLGCEIHSANSVWPHVRAKDVYVSRRRYRNKEIYIQIMAECDWEPEHGLQIVYRKGSDLSRVSAQDGHVTHTDAYGLPEEQDIISRPF